MFCFLMKTKNPFIFFHVSVEQVLQQNVSMYTKSLSVLQIQAHKVGGNTRNSLPAWTKKYWFSTVAIQEGDVREPILTQLPKLHAKESQ